MRWDYTKNLRDIERYLPCVVDDVTWATKSSEGSRVCFSGSFRARRSTGTVNDGKAQPRRVCWEKR